MIYAANNCRGLSGLAPKRSGVSITGLNDEFVIFLIRMERVPCGTTGGDE